MAKLLISATHGYDNASRATMPFYVAKGAKEAGGVAGRVAAEAFIRAHSRHLWRPRSPPPPSP